MKSLTRKVLAELRRYMANFQFEQTPNGILFAKANAFARGVFEHDVNGLDLRRDGNLLTTEGMNHMLDVTFHDATKTSTWYIALFINNITPSNADTAALFQSNAAEFTAYDEATRQAYVEAAASSASTNNTSNKAAFTCNATGTIRGAALHSSSTKSGTSGILMAESKFGTARPVFDDDVLNIGYTVSLTST